MKISKCVCGSTGCEASKHEVFDHGSYMEYHFVKCFHCGIQTLAYNCIEGGAPKAQAVWENFQHTIKTNRQLAAKQHIETLGGGTHGFWCAFKMWLGAKLLGLKVVWTTHYQRPYMHDYHVVSICEKPE